MKQYQINLRIQMLWDVLSGTMYKMHVVAHTLLFCRPLRSRHHLSRKIAQGNVMAPLRHQNGCLPFSATRIKHTQRLARVVGKQRVQILPEDRLTKLTFGGTVNVTGKLLGNIIKIAIPHRALHMLA
jgi:hypothetical protein